MTDTPDFLGPGGEHINPNSIRARLTADRQRDIDARFAAAFSTESELGAYDLEAVRELNRKAI